MAVNSNCYVTGTMSSEDGVSTFIGGCHPDGYVIITGTDDYGYDFIGAGSISESSVSGQWVSESGGEGSFRTGNSSNSDADSDSSGCFIKSLFGM